MFENIKYKLVLIEWADSQLGFTGWKFIKEQQIKLPIVTSVGFLIHEDDTCKVLFPHVHQDCDIDEQSGSGDILIPNTAIIKMIELTIS